MLKIINLYFFIEIKIFLFILEVIIPVKPRVYNEEELRNICKEDKFVKGVLGL